MTYEELMSQLFKTRISFSLSETALLNYISENSEPTTTDIRSNLCLSRRHLLTIKNSINKKLERAGCGIILESICVDIKRQLPNVWRLVIS